MNSFVILVRMGKRLGDSLVSPLGRAMCCESLMQGNKPASGANGDWRLRQNLSDGVLLGIIGGTIGWRVAYSLLRGVDSIAPMGILHLQEIAVDLKRVLGKQLGAAIPREESHVRRARQTYRGLLRQIHAESRVPISLILSTGGNDCSAQSQSKYRYSISKPIAISIEEFESRLRQMRGVTVRVSA